MEPRESFEMRSSGWDEGTFARFCNTLLEAIAARHYGAGFLPRFTSRTKVPDEGLDATIGINESSLETSGGIVGPGLSGYQYKKRDARATRKRVLAEILKDLEKQIPKIRQRHPDLRRYVILTNQDLGPPNSLERVRLEERVVDLWGDRPPEVRLVGSEEIGSLRADYPAVFASFGPDSAFETNEERLVAIENRGKPLDAPSALVGRSDEKEMLRQFLEDEGGGVLFVIGPAGIGKTSLLARTLRDLPEWEGKTVWKLRPHAGELRAELKELLSSGRRAAVVIDEIETKEQAREVLTVCLEAKDLKSILLLRREHAPEERTARLLELSPLPYEDVREFLDALKISDHRLREWIEYRARGIPGVMLEYAALRDVSQLSVDPEEMRRKIDSKLMQLFLPELELQRMVAWLALRPEVDLENLADADRAFAAFVGMDCSDPVSLERHAAILAERKLVEKLGSRVRFEAPFLLGALVSPFYLHAGERLDQLLATTSPNDWAKLLERFESERDNVAAQRLAEQFLEASGAFFPNLDGLRDNAALFVAAGRILPQRAAERASEIFTTSQSKLKDFLAGPKSWGILEFLHQCFGVTGAELSAVHALTVAAIADETGAMAGRPVADRYLLPLWSQLHWFDVGLDFPSRLAILEEMANSEDPRSRALAIRAGEWVLSRWVLEVRSPSTRMTLPGARRPPIPLSDAQNYFEATARLLRKLMSDQDERVAMRAFKTLEENLRPLLGMGVSSDEIGAIIQSLSAQAGKTGRLDLVRWAFTVGIEDLSKEETKSDNRKQWKTKVIELLKKALEALDPAEGFPNFEMEVRDLFTERHSHREPSFWGWTSSPSGRFEANGDTLRLRALKAAEVAASDPSRISNDLLEFLASDKAVFSWLFWRLVGQLDVHRRWRERFISSSPELFAGAFADYAAGWTNVAEVEADDFLDLATADAAKHKFVFPATWKQRPSSRRALRILKIAESGEIPTDRMAATLEWGAWVARLGEAEALPILQAFARHIESIDARPLLRLLNSCFRFEAATPFGEPTKQLSWDVLDQTATTSEEGLTDEWQALAGTLVSKGDVDRGFMLIRRFLDESAGQDPIQPSSLRSLHRWPQLRVALAEADRERFVRLWLAYVLRLPSGWQSLVSGEGVVDPVKDKAIVMEFVGSDPERASGVFATLSGNEPGFLDLARAIVDRTREDLGLWRDIAWRFAYGDVISGPISEHLEHKIMEIRQSGSENTDSAHWQRWVVFAIQDLTRRKRIEENWEFTRGFWDGKPTAEEARSILERPTQDPKRRWLVRRLLENEKASLARKILGDDEIRDATESDEELAPEVTARWRLLVKGTPAWRS
jgi:hypothetical protein